MKYFVRYDPETGNILSQGFMEERHIESLIQSGQSILIVDAPLENMSSLKINLETGKIEYIQVDYDAEMQSTIENVKNILNSTIVRELTRTDYTQANDAVEHMTQEQIDAYKIYRSTLRSAINAPTLLEAIQLLPDVDPKGNSVFQEFKEQLNT
jgi:hypothetical protein